MKIHRLFQRVAPGPEGLLTLAEWNPRRIGRRDRFVMQSLIDSVKRQGFEAIDPVKRVILQLFDPNIDIVLIPHMKGAGNQSFQETLVAQSVAGSTFATYTTAKTVIPATNLYTLPANWFFIGRALRINVTGAISNIVTTPGLMNFQVKIGSVAAFDTGNIQLNATAHTTLPFWLDIFVTCRAIGVTTSANLIGQAIAIGKMFTVTAAQTDGANTNTAILAPATNPAVGTGFDSTIANILDFWVGFTISDAANLIRIDQMIVSMLN